MRKKEVIQVELKPEWNFIAKFYFVCIILFVLFVAYIQIYRYVHRDEIIENLMRRENVSIVENITK